MQEPEYKVNDIVAYRPNDNRFYKATDGMRVAAVIGEDWGSGVLWSYHVRASSRADGFIRVVENEIMLYDTYETARKLCESNRLVSDSGAKNAGSSLPIQP